MLSFYLSMLEEVGEKERFTRIYNKYYNLMYKVAFSMLGDSEFAFDAVQNTFVKIAKNIKSLPSESDPAHEKGYIIKGVKHATINIGKMASLKVHTIELEECYVPSSECSPAEIIIAEEDSRAIIDVMSKMNETYRDILILKYVNGLSAKEISEYLDISYNTVKSQLQRGTEMLKETISKKEKR